MPTTSSWGSSSGNRCDAGPCLALLRRREGLAGHGAAQDGARVEQLEALLLRLARPAGPERLLLALFESCRAREGLASCAHRDGAVALAMPSSCPCSSTAFSRPRLSRCSHADAGPFASSMPGRASSRAPSAAAWKDAGRESGAAIGTVTRVACAA